MDDDERDFRQWERAITEIGDRRHRYRGLERERARFQKQEVPHELLMQVVEAQHLDTWFTLATVPREGKKTTSIAAARELCAVASVCLARDKPMPERVRAHLAAALKTGAEGGSVDAALRLKRGAGQARDADPMDQIQKERMIAWFMKHLIDIDGLSEAEAKEHACQQFYLDTRAVELYWARHRESAQAKHFFHEENEIIYDHLCKARAK